MKKRYNNMYSGNGEFDRDDYDDYDDYDCGDDNDNMYSGNGEFDCDEYDDDDDDDSGYGKRDLTENYLHENNDISPEEELFIVDIIMGW